jgi:cytochrome c553
MKTIKIKSLTIAYIIFFAVGSAMIISGCAATKDVASKSGAQLWSENCGRCHNAPASTTFSSEQWKTIGMHMQTRALLTDQERDKIIDF